MAAQIKKFYLLEKLTMSLHQPYFHITIYCPLWLGGLQQLPLIGIIWLLTTTTLMLRLLGKWRKFNHHHTLPACIGQHKQKNKSLYNSFFPPSVHWPTAETHFKIAKKVVFAMFYQKHSTTSRSRLSRLIYDGRRPMPLPWNGLPAFFLAAHRLLDRSHHTLMKWGQISSSSLCCRCHMLLGHSFGNQQLG